MRTYTKNEGTIIQSAGWFTASFNVAAGTLSKQFKSISDAQKFLIKQKRA
tara:strand:+ start:326 stop:475 length:150 start_codon:yes stop_codon:yes gene_type:complete